MFNLIIRIESFMDRLIFWLSRHRRYRLDSEYPWWKITINNLEYKADHMS